MKKLCSLLIAAFVASLATLGLGPGTAQATTLPDTWTYYNAGPDSHNYEVNCGIKWHQHSSGTDNWTPVAMEFTPDGPTIFEATLAHYADPSYTRYGTWGPYDNVNGWHATGYSAYITSDNKYDDQSSSVVIFHFTTGSGDYPCYVTPPNLL